MLGEVAVVAQKIFTPIEMIYSYEIGGGRSVAYYLFAVI